MPVCLDRLSDLCYVKYCRGFTSWSATRTPTDVFQLLETLYDAFDKIAARKKVFKIETIVCCHRDTRLQVYVQWSLTPFVIHIYLHGMFRQGDCYGKFLAFLCIRALLLASA